MSPPFRRIREQAICESYFQPPAGLCVERDLVGLDDLEVGSQFFFSRIREGKSEP